MAQFLKSHLKGGYYLRYCHDFVLLHKEKGKEKLMAAWSFYMAHLKMANTYRLREKLLDLYCWLGFFFHRKEKKIIKEEERLSPDLKRRCVAEGWMPVPSMADRFSF